MWNKILSLFGIFMVMFYILIGFFLLLFPSYFTGFRDLHRIVFGAAIILYGGYRGYQVYRKFQEKDDDDDDES